MPSGTGSAAAVVGEVVVVDVTVVVEVAVLVLQPAGCNTPASPEPDVPPCGT